MKISELTGTQTKVEKLCVSEKDAQRGRLPDQRLETGQITDHKTGRKMTTVTKDMLKRTRKMKIEYALLSELRRRMAETRSRSDAANAVHALADEEVDRHRRDVENLEITVQLAKIELKLTKDTRRKSKRNLEKCRRDFQKTRRMAQCFARRVLTHTVVISE